jgi:hypothetical protein
MAATVNNSTHATAATIRFIWTAHAESSSREGHAQDISTRMEADSMKV